MPSSPKGVLSKFHEHRDFAFAHKSWNFEQMEFKQEPCFEDFCPGSGEHTRQDAWVGPLGRT